MITQWVLEKNLLRKGDRRMEKYTCDYSDYVRVKNYFDNIDNELTEIGGTKEFTSGVWEEELLLCGEQIHDAKLHLFEARKYLLRYMERHDEHIAQEEQEC